MGMQNRKKRAGSAGKRNRIQTDSAFTGLEAALILIAFVVVAAVFSYTLLNTGFMTTQKSRTAIFTAVEQTTSTLDISSNVYGIGEAGSPSEIYRVNFSCRISPSGSAVDFDKVVLTYSNASQLQTLVRDPATYNPAGCIKESGTWAVFEKEMDNGSDNNLLEPGEQFVISACPVRPIIAGDAFTIEVKPAIGVSLGISRTIPLEPKIVNSLH
jgi:flagellin FlaB